MITALLLVDNYVLFKRQLIKAHEAVALSDFFSVVYKFSYLLFVTGRRQSTSHSDIEIAADRGKLGVRICAQYHVVSLSSACPPRGRRPSTGLDELACSERLCTVQQSARVVVLVDRGFFCIHVRHCQPCTLFTVITPLS